MREDKASKHIVSAGKRKIVSVAEDKKYQYILNFVDRINCSEVVRNTEVNDDNSKYIYNATYATIRYYQKAQIERKIPNLKPEINSKVKKL